MKKTKVCTSCKMALPISRFGRSGKYKNNGGIYFSPRCKECRCKDVAIWRLKTGYKPSKEPISYRIRNIMTHLCHARSKIKSRYISNMYDIQKGCCLYSGVKMKLESEIRRDPLLMSVDRIDPKCGYEEGNIVLCCLGLNSLKGTESIGRLYELLDLFYNGARIKGVYKTGGSKQAAPLQKNPANANRYLAQNPIPIY